MVELKIMPEKFVANGFSTVLPVGWQDRSVISLVNPATDSGFATNIVVLREQVAPDTSIEDYAREQIAAMQNGLENLQILDERATTVQNLPAYQTLQRVAANKRLLQQAQTYVLSGDTVYAITCTALIEEFDRAIPAFREVVENLDFD